MIKQNYTIDNPDELLQFFIKEMRKAIKEEIQSSNLRSGKFEKLPTYLKVKEICELFHVSIQTVYNWIDTGLIKRYKMNSRVFFKRDEIIDLLNIDKNKR